MNEEDIVEDYKYASNDEEDKDRKVDKVFEKQVLSGEPVVEINDLYHSEEYFDRIRRHTKENTSDGLLEFLIIADLEYHRDWEEPKKPYWCVFTPTPRIIDVVTSYHCSLREMKVTTPEKMLKNIQHIQNNLKLMEWRMFDFKEFIIVHHVLVDYFKMLSFVVPEEAPQAQLQAVVDINATRHSPETSIHSEISCHVTEHKTQQGLNHNWIGYSGASCHMTCSDEGMFNCRMIKSSVKIGNGKELQATKIGDKRMTVVQKDG
jgi:hypothetical protein